MQHTVIMNEDGVLERILDVLGGASRITPSRSASSTPRTLACRSTANG